MKTNLGPYIKLETRNPKPEILNLLLVGPFQGQLLKKEVYHKSDR